MFIGKGISFVLGAIVAAVCMSCSYTNATPLYRIEDLGPTNTEIDRVSSVDSTLALVTIPPSLDGNDGFVYRPDGTTIPSSASGLYPFVNAINRYGTAVGGVLDEVDGLLHLARFDGTNVLDLGPIGLAGGFGSDINRRHLVRTDPDRSRHSGIARRRIFHGLFLRS